MQIVMTSDETQIQIFANWPVSHAKRVTGDNGKNPEYHFAAIRNCGQTQTVPQEKMRTPEDEVEVPVGGP